MERWAGRIGNNVRQIVNAVVLAKWAHCPKVELPPTGLWLPTVLDVAGSINADVEEGETWWTRTFTCSCAENFTDLRFLLDTACAVRDPGAEVAAWSAVRRSIVLDLFWSKARPEYTNCTEPDQSTLTIHGRYGDVGPGGGVDRMQHLQAHLYPCSFYDHLIDAHNFNKVVFLLEEKDLKRHPCATWLPKRSDIRVQFVTTLAGAICNIVKASNLVVPRSSLSQTFVFANRNVSRVFGAKDLRLSMKDEEAYVVQPVAAEKCRLGSPEFFAYDIEGFAENHTGSAKIAYMTRRGLKVSVASKGCLF